MKEIKPELETFARIKVVGVGGGGNHAISRMMEANLKGIEFIAVNADAQDLHHCKVPEKIHIGKNLTRGLGAGMNPDIGRQAAEENKDEIQDALKNADMVFVTCGLGGGTGTGAAPIIAEAAKDAGALTVAVVTKPFTFEGMQRRKIAEAGLEALRANVDTIVTVPNDRILQVIDKNTPLLESFRIVDDVLRQAVQGISDLITSPGDVNVDFADVRAIMQNTGPALMGIGYASGENRATEAAKMAINSPLLELSIDGARGVLFNISGPDLTLMEVNDAAQIITESADPEARVIFGASTNEELKKGEVKITVIATGFQDPKTVRTYEKMLDDIESPEAKAEAPKPRMETRPEPVRPKAAVPEPRQENPTFSKKDLSNSIIGALKRDMGRDKEDKPQEKRAEPVSVKQVFNPLIGRTILPAKEPEQRVEAPSNDVPVRPRMQEESEKRRESEPPAKMFSPRINDIKYDDEYDIPAFLRKKMDKNKNNQD